MDPNTFEFSNIKYCGLMVLPFGIYSGVAFRYYFLEDPNDQPESLIQSIQTFQNFGLVLLKFLLRIAFLMPVLVVLWVSIEIKSSLYDWAYMLIGIATPCWLGGFLIFAGLPDYYMRKYCNQMSR